MIAAFDRRHVSIASIWSAVALCCSIGGHASAPATETVMLRGQRQVLRLYGGRGGDPIVVSSGDGGWIHLGPHVAEVLAGRGFFVLGLDVKAYLAGFTSGATTLRREDAAADYRVLAELAARGTTKKPILVGVSEGAGLSVLAATDPRTKAAIAGVIGLGLPDVNELGWRWKDSLIYVTHGVPNEPTFSTAAIVGQMSPLPLGAIHSTHDEFVSVAQVEKVLAHASDPNKLWIVSGSDHRFSGNTVEFDRRLIEAIEWVRLNTPQ